MLQSLFRTTKQLTGDDPEGLIILPGSGINAASVGAILDSLSPYGLREIHLSGGSWNEGGMEYRREGLGMGVGREGEWGVWMTAEENVREVRKIADAHWARLKIDT